MSKENQPLPAKVTGGWIESFHDIPDYIWEQAKADFTAFYEKLQDFVAADAEVAEALEDYDFTLSDREFYEQHLKLNHEADPPVPRKARAGLNALLGQLIRKHWEAFAKSLGWEATVTFRVRALTMREKSYLEGTNIEANTISPGTIAFDMVRIGLQELNGVDDPATGKPLKLKRKGVKAAKTEMIMGSVIEKLPDGLLPEIVQALGDTLRVTEEEEEEVNFTSTSSSDSEASQDASATTAKPPSGKSESAPTSAEPEESS